MKKVSIVGNSGAGKSTLANQLGMQLGIEVFTVDKVYWKAGWVLRDQESFREIHENWLAKESWIIDGVGYWDELVSRLHESDLVVFLDVSASICKQQAFIRIEEERQSPNRNIASGCVYGEVVNLQLEVIESFDSSVRPKLIELLSKFDSDKVRVIKSADDFSVV
jgi:adenylate kinase family enzyme